MPVLVKLSTKASQTMRSKFSILFFNFFGPMEFSINFDTVKSGWFIVYIQGKQAIFSKKCVFLSLKINFGLGAQWLSCRVLDSRPKGRGFEPHRRHCVVVLEQDTFILA